MGDTYYTIPVQREPHFRDRPCAFTSLPIENGARIIKSAMFFRRANRCKQNGALSSMNRANESPEGDFRIFARRAKNKQGEQIVPLLRASYTCVFIDSAFSWNTINPRMSPCCRKLISPRSRELREYCEDTRLISPLTNATRLLREC